jgi:hypothetical protein
VPAVPQLAFWQAGLGYPIRMDLTPIDLSDSSCTPLPRADIPAFAYPARGHSLMAMRWDTVHAAVEAVTFFAGLTPVEVGPEVRNFPEAMHQCGGWRRDFAEQGVEDLIAMLEPGVTALLAVHDSGADARPAAMALWQEFETARDALIALAPSASKDCGA